MCISWHRVLKASLSSIQQPDYQTARNKKGKNGILSGKCTLLNYEQVVLTDPQRDGLQSGSKRCQAGLGEGENPLALPHLPTLTLPVFSKMFFNFVNTISGLPEQIGKVVAFCFLAVFFPSVRSPITLFVMLQPQPAPS